MTLASLLNGEQEEVDLPCTWEMVWTEISLEKKYFLSMACSVTKKNGKIFRYNFVVGVQIVPKKCLCDRTENDGWDRCQGQKLSGVVSISRGETHQPTHNNQKIRQVSGGTTRHEASGRRITW